MGVPSFKGTSQRHATPNEPRGKIVRMIYVTRPLPWAGRSAHDDRPGAALDQSATKSRPKHAGLTEAVRSAEGGTRTPTSLRPLAPEASASTSSTTSAQKQKA